MNIEETQERPAPGGAPPLPVVLAERSPGCETALARELAAAGCSVQCIPLHAVLAAPEILHQAWMLIVEIRLDDDRALEVGRLAKAGPAGAPMLLLSTSTLGDRRYFELSQEAGFDAHIVKPIPLRRLLAMLVRG